MASGVTNAGKRLLLEYAFESVSPPSSYYVALCTSATTPDEDINTLSQMTQISGGGYAALAVAARSGFTTSEDDSGDRGKTILADQVWTASGADLGPARWAVLCDGNGGGDEIMAWFDLSSDRTVSDGQTLTLAACELRLDKP